jgi:hypothetical protein
MVAVRPGVPHPRSSRHVRPVYPDTRIPQHIHYQVSADGFQNHTGELLFADDLRLEGE